MLTLSIYRVFSQDQGGHSFSACHAARPASSRASPSGATRVPVAAGAVPAFLRHCRYAANTAARLPGTRRHASFPDEGGGFNAETAATRSERAGMFKIIFFYFSGRYKFFGSGGSAVPTEKNAFS
jgi:hypothetical protein